MYMCCVCVLCTCVHVRQTTNQKMEMLYYSTQMHMMMMTMMAHNLRNEAVPDETFWRAYCEYCKRALAR